MDPQRPRGKVGPCSQSGLAGPRTAESAYGGPVAEFIQTEEFGGPGEQGERYVWEAVKAALAGRDALAFWRYPVVEEAVREPDILILDAELGLIIIEVKSLPLGQIRRLSGYQWDLNEPYFGKWAINPYEQAKAQLQAVLKQLRNRPGLSRVPGRVLVAVPLITRDEWEEAPFNTLVSETPLLFADQFSKVKLLRALERTPLIAQGDLLDEQRWTLLQRAFSTSGHIKQVAPEAEEAAARAVADARGAQAAAVHPAALLLDAPPPRPSLPRRTRGELVRLVRDAPSPIDLQQDRIAKTIPPGPQRIRGLAGSGKTVLLAQKAAAMHLKYPDWDIAFVFFSRSLYDQITKWVDYWLRVQSNGDVTLADARHKLRILHAWGAREQPGFYRLLAENVNVDPLAVGHIPKRFAYGKGLIYACKRLLEAAEEQQLNLEFFDAVLIDEGQDLVSELDDLRYEERQALYWLAYQSLRPVRAQPGLMDDVIPTSKPLRRLIWAYDEAQSLDSLIIPDTRTVFGHSWEEVFGAGRQYSGGIGKSEVMKVCYRVPGPTLVAAHALGMGLLRPGGMLSGPTRKADWENLGYHVEGDFRTRSLVTLSRPEKNSPHPLPSLTSDPLVSFTSHVDRDEEVSALVRLVQRDIAEGLDPSRHILIVHLGTEGILTSIHKAFRAAGLTYYCAGKPQPNQVYGKGNPNDFWHPGAVTVTGIHQVKGNEAESVYVVGLDKVAADEDDVHLRNHLFVAMSRSKGWVHLSGVNVAATPLGAEVSEVIRQGTTLRFTPSQPRRSLDDQDAGEAELFML